MTTIRPGADTEADVVGEAEPFPWPPTEDELPDSDGQPLDNERQGVQMNLLAGPAKRYFEARDDVYVGANMIVYFSLNQLTTEDFRGPDVFVVTGTVKRERRSWVSWQEGKGPDVVIEILSDSTRRIDKTVKKEIYATRLRVPEYFWYDPFTGELAGWELVCGEYAPIPPDADSRLPSRMLGLTLTRWQGVSEGIEATWLRWATVDGVLLPTRDEAERERAEAERERADQAEAATAEQRRRADAAERAATEARAEAERERRRVAELEARLARYE